MFQYTFICFRIRKKKNLKTLTNISMFNVAVIHIMTIT